MIGVLPIRIQPLSSNRVLVKNPRGLELDILDVGNGSFAVAVGENLVYIQPDGRIVVPAVAGLVVVFQQPTGSGSEGSP